MPLEHPIAINSVTYPVESWETVGQGRLLRKRWRHGFQRMGTWYDGSEQEDAFEYYQALNMDMASYPEARLRPALAASITCTGLDALTNPVYFMRALETNEYVYVFNGTKVFKIKTSDNTLVNTRTFTGEKCGRPVWFEGKIHLPLGNGNNARSLDTITTDTSNDTWGDLGASTTDALHFATRTVNGAAQIVGAFHPNLVKVSTDGTTFSPGAGFEVGDSTLAITDMHSWMGEIAVVTPANVFRFDDLGNAVALQDFVAKTASPALKDDDGSNSFVFGPFFYWVHLSSLARLVGNSYLPVGPQDTPAWVDRLLGLLTTFNSAPWLSGAAYGRWAYFTKGEMLLQAFINEDGTLDWQGRVQQLSGSVIRCGITEGPILWVADGATPSVHRINLQTDGSMKTAGGSNRGAVSETARLYLPNIDFGLGGDRQFQLSRFAILLTGTFDANDNITVLLRVRRDEGSEETVSGSIVGNGYFESSWTVGSNDLARFVQPVVTIVTDGGYDPSTEDPRIRGLYIEARSPEVYRARIPLTDADLAEAGSTLTIADALKNLHDLRGKPAVEIREPGMASTFSGHIVGVEEQFSDKGKSVSVLIERFDWSYAK